MDVTIIIQLAILVVMIIIAWQINKLVGAVLKISPVNKKLPEDINQIASDIHMLTETLGKFNQGKIREFSDKSDKNENMTNRDMMADASDPLSGPIPPKGGPHYIQVVVIDPEFT